jgi:hypothetical protein
MTTRPPPARAPAAAVDPDHPAAGGTAQQDRLERRAAGRRTKLDPFELVEVGGVEQLGVDRDHRHALRLAGHGGAADDQRPQEGPAQHQGFDSGLPGRSGVAPWSEIGT